MQSVDSGQLGNQSQRFNTVYALKFDSLARSTEIGEANDL